MSCCGPVLVAAPSADDELRLASRVIGPDLRQTDLSVPAIHCGGCISTIERALGALPGVVQARVNLSTRRVSVRWRGAMPPPLVATLRHAGYDAHLHDIDADAPDPALRELVRALAVSGFAASNIMMLSVAVWSGADAGTRDLFHGLSAALALPALVYGGRVFFRSAWRALRAGRTNMDVPISVGVALAVGLSLYETLVHGPHAYFDAAISLLFFLLIGRTLDLVMRARARTAVSGLARLAARGALVLEPDGSRHYLPVDELTPGMTLLLAAGERVPVDGQVIAGRSELDAALVSGESVPVPVAAGAALQAGTLNLTGPLTMVATAAARDSVLAEMTRMMDAAAGGRSRPRRIADRAAQLYAPVIHLTALLTFVGWMAATGDLHRAITIAIAVLIITCPCALGLAVPMVQVVAARRLFERGIMVKDGSALERLADVDHVVFDKTGTLTHGTPELRDAAATPTRALAIAAALAAHSRHPYSLALAAAGRAAAMPPVTLHDVAEQPGCGLLGRLDGAIWRLGRADWALADPAGARDDDDAVVLSQDGRRVAGFRLTDALRPDARAAIGALMARGLTIEILSGDRAAPVRRLATALGVPAETHAVAQASPGDKAARLAAHATAGRKVLMVGDGLNDAPALVAAHVSMAPGSAADVGRNAADFVFLRDGLLAVEQAIEIACRADRLARQNLLLAVAYNAVAIPVAVLGLVTPLLAAIAMSLSSILVVANALRLGRRRDAPPAPRPAAAARTASPAGAR